MGVEKRTLLVQATVAVEVDVTDADEETVRIRMGRAIDRLNEITTLSDDYSFLPGTVKGTVINHGTDET